MQDSAHTKRLNLVLALPASKTPKYKERHAETREEGRSETQESHRDPRTHAEGPWRCPELSPLDTALVPPSVPILFTSHTSVTFDPVRQIAPQSNRSQTKAMVCHRATHHPPPSVFNEPSANSFCREFPLHMCPPMHQRPSSTNIPDALSSPARITSTFSSGNLHVRPSSLKALIQRVPQETAFSTQLAGPARHNEKKLCCVQPQLMTCVCAFSLVRRVQHRIRIWKNAKKLSPIAIFRLVTVVLHTLGFRTSAGNLLPKRPPPTLIASLVPVPYFHRVYFVNVCA